MTVDVVIQEPQKVQVTRWRCPFCGRSHSGRSRAAGHMVRCWRNPAARSCKTCLNYQPAESCDPHLCGCGGSSEGCLAGVEIPVPSEDRPDRKVLPINCPLWQLDKQAVEL